jgi:hypothetical protein
LAWVRAARPWSVVFGLCGLLLAGCQPQDEITRYTVTKPELIQSAGGVSAPATRGEPQQTLAAITMVENDGWFFKLSGSPTRVAKQEANFQEFLKSVRFAGEKKEPKWTLPEGWSLGSPSSIRFATLVTDADSPPLELSVTRLAKSAASDEDYVLANFNRWRGQLQLPDLKDAAALSEQATKEDIDGKTFWVANYTGTTSGDSGMKLGPFAGGNHPPIDAGPVKQPAGDSASGSGVKFDTPEGWKEIPASPPFSFAKFAVEREGKKLDVSVSTAGGTLLANVNRWRGQIGLSEVDAEQLAESLRPIDIGSEKGQFVELVGSAETILGVIATHGGQSWFVKLRGDAALAAREKARFEAFVKSLKLP